MAHVFELFGMCRVNSLNRIPLAVILSTRYMKSSENVLLSGQNCQNISGEKTHRCNVNLKQ